MPRTNRHALLFAVAMALATACGCGGGNSDPVDGVPNPIGDTGGTTRVDVDVDRDGDGFAPADGDLDDTDPLVNPGALEVPRNGIDDDCDPTTSDLLPPSSCSASALFGGVTPEDVAGALELCQTTTLDAPLPERRWGVINIEFVNADGSTPTAARLRDMQNWQIAILENYGTGGVVPRGGGTMVGISTGTMRDQGDGGFSAPDPGTDFGATGSPPAAYLAAHGGSLPSYTGCDGPCPAGSGANDSVNVRITIRVPTNVLAFSYDHAFFTAEYKSWACSIYNDFTLALLTSTAAGLPADGNIAFDAQGAPISVNSGFFAHCAAQGCYTCPGGTGLLAGTGMDLDGVGGGTGWLTTTAPVVPGEIITLELMVFDVTDGTLDSVLLLDNFRWHLNPAVVGTGSPD